MSFADKLAAALALRGLTQGQLHVKSGVGQAHISMILKGQRDPAVSSAARLAEALEVPLDWLCDLPPRTAGQLTPDEDQLLRIYRSLSEEQRDMILRMMQSLSA